MNDARKDQTTCRVPLAGGGFALVDAADRDAVSKYSWHRARRYSVTYAATHLSRSKKVYLHQLIMGDRPGMVIDHKDRDGLNCRRSNMRFATRGSNARNSKPRRHNTSGYRGVYLCKATGRWRAEIRVDGRGIKLGRFDDKESAARAYDAAAKERHGEFAVLNFPA